MSGGLPSGVPRGRGSGGRGSIGPFEDRGRSEWEVLAW